MVTMTTATSRPATAAAAGRKNLLPQVGVRHSRLVDVHPHATYLNHLHKHKHKGQTSMRVRVCIKSGWQPKKMTDTYAHLFLRWLFRRIALPVTFRHRARHAETESLFSSVKSLCARCTRHVLVNMQGVRFASSKNKSTDLLCEIPVFTNTQTVKTNKPTKHV